jgi:hypothetical protein
MDNKKTAQKIRPSRIKKGASTTFKSASPIDFAYLMKVKKAVIGE